MLRWHVGTRANAAHSEHASPTESSDYLAKQVVVNSLHFHQLYFVFAQKLAIFAHESILFRNMYHDMGHRKSSFAQIIE